MPNTEIPNIYREAVTKAMSLHLPFALFAMPGSNEYSFFASRPDDVNYNAINSGILKGKAFFATRFAAPLAHGVMIKNELSAEEVIALPESTEPWPGAEISAHTTSTSYPNYYGQLRTFRRAIGRRKITKAVLSRRIALESDINAIDLADQYFAKLPDTFRALFFTQESGLWLTATPELLLAAHCDSDDDDAPIRFEAMSLAGTRPALTSKEWDEKNNTEHSTVLDFIYNTLSEEGLNPTVHERIPLRFGEVEHLCHEISATGHTNVFNLVDKLSPTPALGGHPVDAAVKLIGDTELHNRYYYGGVIGIINENDFRAYVNIRCAMISPSISESGGILINIFAGGGIMKDSKPQREWIEAANKAMPLYSILRPQSPDAIAGIPSPWSDLKER